MLTLYVYEAETMIHVATVIGADNAACEAKADDLFLGDNSYAYTYTPAFGIKDGLNESDYALKYKA